MSYFLCLAVPKGMSHKLSLVFDRCVHLTDVTDFPIGEATKGKNKLWRVFNLQVGSSSASLIGRGAIKVSARNNDRTGLFISGLEALLEEDNRLSLCILIHWMSGSMTTEKFDVSEERPLSLMSFKRDISILQENIRFLVHR